MRCDAPALYKDVIGLYSDVWIAAIASSRTSLATLMGVMFNTSQCELHSLRVNSGMLNVIRIVTYYTLPDRVARLFLDCNGVFAIKAYGMRCDAPALYKDVMECAALLLDLIVGVQHVTAGRRRIVV